MSQKEVSYKLADEIVESPLLCEREKYLRYGEFDEGLLITTGTGMTYIEEQQLLFKQAMKRI